MILFDLFITFFKIGLFSFGGGASMIPLLQQEVFAHGWLSEGDLLNYIAISESTPGPIAINMATFVGSTQGGLLGSLFATLGVILPSFIIILFIASCMKRFAEYRVVQTVLRSIRPIVVGMILASGLYLALTALGLHNYQSIAIDLKCVVMTAVLAVIMIGYKKLRGKHIGVIPFILTAAAIGIATNLIAGFIA